MHIPHTCTVDPMPYKYIIATLLFRSRDTVLGIAAIFVLINYHVVSFA